MRIDGRTEITREEFRRRYGSVFEVCGVRVTEVPRHEDENSIPTFKIHRFQDFGEAQREALRNREKQLLADIAAARRRLAGQWWSGRVFHGRETRKWLREEIRGHDEDLVRTVRAIAGTADASSIIDIELLPDPVPVAAGIEEGMPVWTVIFEIADEVLRLRVEQDAIVHVRALAAKGSNGTFDLICVTGSGRRFSTRSLARNGGFTGAGGCFHYLCEAAAQRHARLLARRAAHDIAEYLLPERRGLPFAG